jgi:hypothetical protein
MEPRDIWWDYWYFHLPNYAMAALFYTLFGRFLLSFILPPDTPNYIYRWFHRLTEWLIRPVAFITPRAIAPRYHAPVAAFWIVVARVLYITVLLAAGWAPKVGASGQ